ncbi:hypothetical protein BET03_00085 [Thermohalobacter berrensis]|uniref:UV damage repair endonuclease UvsE n=1 Tax=Thermohalobacter berrensis TaxID=99594 RepID=A0A419T9Z1_9FIRM|nr:hypothetical protein BET03_00085 [Thermohalobacter berrensis]
MSTNIKRRLVIENDEKNYTINDVLLISSKIGIPVVFDNLHHEINGDNSDIKEIILKCRKTWREKDGLQKIHYSQQAKGKKVGKHSDTIEPKTFLNFLKKIKGIDLDIMFEVKDKNISVEKIHDILKNKAHV